MGFGGAGHSTGANSVALVMEFGRIRSVDFGVASEHYNSERGSYVPCNPIETRMRMGLVQREDIPDVLRIPRDQSTTRTEVDSASQMGTEGAGRGSLPAKDGCKTTLAAVSCREGPSSAYPRHLGELGDQQSRVPHTRRRGLDHSTGKSFRGSLSLDHSLRALAAEDGLMGPGQEAQGCWAKQQARDRRCQNRTRLG
jgi:hypothetical protein